MLHPTIYRTMLIIHTFFLSKRFSAAPRQDFWWCTWIDVYHFQNAIKYIMSFFFIYMVTITYHPSDMTPKWPCIIWENPKAFGFSQHQFIFVGRTSWDLYDNVEIWKFGDFYLKMQIYLKAEKSKNEKRRLYIYKLYKLSKQKISK